ncbi:MAG: transcription termination factor NusA [Planctomycetota bacterium]|nr:transcription termination factor NusA [Planctomycetota bacterium]
MNGDLLRYVEAIHRDKAIGKDLIFQGIEMALQSAARKRFGVRNEVIVRIDRETGNIIAEGGQGQIDPTELGRIAAQTARQVIMQKIREAERDVLFADFEARKNYLVNGSVTRIEGNQLVVTISKTEAILPKSELMPGETYRVGERIRAFVLDVKRRGARIKIVLSRAHPEFVKELFLIEVPELSDGTVLVKAIAREAGHKTKIAVMSTDPAVDPVGACVGVRGARIRNITDELGGERVDVIKWSDNFEELIRNSLSPAGITSVEIDETTKRTKVLVSKDQLSLAIGKRGQNVRLAAKLAQTEIDIVCTDDPNADVEEAEEGVDTAEVAAPGVTAQAEDEAKAIATESNGSAEKTVKDEDVKDSNEDGDSTSTKAAAGE